MRADADHILLSWFSPGYPVGAFAYSHGLERDIARGAVWNADTLADWIDTVLAHGTGRADAIIMRAVLAGDPPEDMADLALALAASSERAMEVSALGAAFARVTSAVWGTPDDPWPYPVAVAVAARALGLPEAALLRAYLHAMAANLVSVAVRFVPLGQTDGQRVLAGRFALIDSVVSGTEFAVPDDILTAAFAADLAAMEHETMDVRLYRS
ncbi:urease accessory protein UreF [Oceanibium sediminis]|uniref:urease accessory protein UreF n=1 Tax=Oceanibium sediminis TaxID=2026339 RepID=UPI000DD33899|nr:urease accessory UreF family protein [Oceanibium sediminis]